MPARAAQCRSLVAGGLLMVASCLCPVAVQAQRSSPGGAVGAEPLGVPDTARLRAIVRALSSHARVAGSPGSDSGAAYVLSQLAGAPFETSTASFRVYLPLQDSAIVEVSAGGAPERLALEEPVLPDDPYSHGSAWPAMNGSSGSGDVRAPLVYANYGLEADYRTLDSLGVDVRGRVIVARYGRGFRGIKARDAERRGAAALLLYSDPADDGFVQGDPYPVGPMRPPGGIQRGSIKNQPGDPSTPLWSSTPDARRLSEPEMEAVRIPVLPIGYGNAARLLGLLTQGELPQSWQGGLPFRYHTHGAGVEVRVATYVESGDRAYKTITNTVATIVGREFPDEIVVVGGHRDSWGPGAADNASGTASVLEAARLLAEAARRGEGPRRTVVFATWDAEERGLIGSTEW
ncbi:MAG TPA: M28 family peptidase, partial [Gemmatimonadales bacterium]|nr:M28 family peptidase [Gemmatimonadales bacterium]